MSIFRVSENSRAVCGIYCDKGMEKAAEQLKIYLEKITGAEYECLAEKTGARFEIVLDERVRYFEWEIKGDAFILSAPTDVKAGWGVFHMLDKLAGCVFCTSEYEVVPENKNLILETEAYTHNPAFEYNDVYYRDYENSLFAMKMGTAHMAFSNGEEVALWGNGNSHTLGHMIGFERYDEHPEYFCMRDGKRLVPEKMMTLGGRMHVGNMQICLTNPDVFDIVCESLEKQMAEKPEAIYWSVSQDDNENFCECPECARVDAEEGSHMGTYMRFVNRVAERFPDKIISTLAYNYTTEPCKTRPAKNVNIVLCNGATWRNFPIETNANNEGVKNQLLKWREIAEDIYYWDYCISFDHLYSPHPNFRTLAQNMKFFAGGGIKTLFSQCNREKGGEFAELRGYYIAKLAENPWQDADALMKKFCDAYYGAASPYIIEYINTMHDALEKVKWFRMWVFDHPADHAGTFLTRKLFYRYMELFDKAEEAVKDDEVLLNHVRVSRMPLYYAGVEIGYGDKFERYEMLAKFARLAEENDVDMVWEVGGHETRRKWIAQAMARMADELE